MTTLIHYLQSIFIEENTYAILFCVPFLLVMTYGVITAFSDIFKRNWKRLWFSLARIYVPAFFLYQIAKGHFFK